MDGKEIRVGLIGIGGRGKNGWKVHQPERNCTVVFGADPSEKARAEFKENFPNADVSADYRDLVRRKDIDAVFITTPDFLHEEMAVACLESGKAVYLEKPMTISIEGCDRVLETAYRTGSKVFVGHNMRHYPVMMKMKELISSGIIGQVMCGWCRHFISYGGDAYFRDWHSERKNTCGLLLQKGAHDIDNLHWLMGSYTRKVVGMGMLSVYNQCERRSADTPPEREWLNDRYPPLGLGGFSPVIDVEDHNMILMQLENGAQASYMQCHYAPDAERNYTFIGTKGRLENFGDSGAAEIKIWTSRGMRTEPDMICKLKGGTGSHDGADVPIIKNFLDFVQFGAKTITTPIAGRNAVAVGVLGHLSMRTDCSAREIPPLSPELIAYFENNQKR